MTTHSATEVPLPMWSAVLLAIGIALMVGGFTAMVLAKQAKWERRFYWATWLLGGGVGSASLVPRGFGLAIATYLAFVFVSVVWAFFRTNYIKVGERIIAAIPDDRRPDSRK